MPPCQPRRDPPWGPDHAGRRGMVHHRRPGRPDEMWQRRHRQETEGQLPPQHGRSPAHSPLPGSFQGHAPALLCAPRAVTQRSWDPWSYGHSLSMEDFEQSSTRAPTKPEATSATSALPRLPADTPGACSQRPSATADGGDRVAPALTTKCRPSPQLHCVFVSPQGTC